MQKSSLSRILSANVIESPFDAERFSLDWTRVKLGEVVHVTDTGAFYLIKNPQELDNEAGYQQIGAIVGLTGTPNQVVVTSGGGGTTLSLPQSIAITSTPQFLRLGLGTPSATNMGLAVGGGVIGDAGAGAYGIDLSADITASDTGEELAGVLVHPQFIKAGFNNLLAYGVKITMQGSGSGTGLIAAALEIDAVTMGSTFNYAIRTAAGFVEFGDTTDSTTSITGALRTLGGLGIARACSVGTTLRVSGIAAVGIATSSSTILNLAASIPGTSSLRVAHGTAPSAPVNGDIWTTTTGLFVRINGATVGPLT